MPAIFLPPSPTLPSQQWHSQRGRRVSTVLGIASQLSWASRLNCLGHRVSTVLGIASQLSWASRLNCFNPLQFCSLSLHFVTYIPNTVHFSCHWQRDQDEYERLMNAKGKKRRGRRKKEDTVELHFWQDKKVILVSIAAFIVSIVSLYLFFIAWLHSRE